MLNLTCFINDILFLVVTLLICDIIFFPFLSFRISINLIQNCKIALRRKTQGKFEKMFNFEIFYNELIKKLNIFFFIVPTIIFFYHDSAPVVRIPLKAWTNVLFACRWYPGVMKVLCTSCALFVWEGIPHPTSRCRHVDVSINGRTLRSLMNTTFQELPLVTSENLALFKVL